MMAWDPGCELNHFSAVQLRAMGCIPSFTFRHSTHFHIVSILEYLQSRPMWHDTDTCAHIEYVSKWKPRQWATSQGLIQSGNI